VRWNVINAVAPSEELDGLIDGVIGKLGLAAPGAVAMGKKVLFEIGDLDMAQGLAFAERAIAALAVSTEAAEGRAAFAEKRKPAWAVTPPSEA
jgi:enoyl-CoA hydratase/carnithine racemase